MKNDLDLLRYFTKRSHHLNRLLSIPTGENSAIIIALEVIRTPFHTGFSTWSPLSFTPWRFHIQVLYLDDLDFYIFLGARRFDIIIIRKSTVTTRRLLEMVNSSKGKWQTHPNLPGYQPVAYNESKEHMTRY